MAPAVEFCKRTIKAFGDDQVSSFAAAIAYHTLFSIFPLAVALIGFAGYVVTNQQRVDLANKIATSLGGASQNNIQSQIQSFASGKAGAGIIGLLIALWSSSGIFTAIRTGMNVVWHAKSKRKFYVAKALDLVGVVGLGLMLASSFAATIALTFITTIVSNVAGAQVAGALSWLLGIVLLILPLVIVFTGFWLLYMLLSPPEVRWLDVWPGAVVAAVGFEAISLLFGYYVSALGHYSAYGAIGGVIAFLFYAYLLGTIILLGAEIAAQYVPLRRQAHSRSTAAAVQLEERFKPPLVVARPAAKADGNARPEDLVTAGELFPAGGPPSPKVRLVGAEQGDDHG